MAIKNPWCGVAGLPAPVWIVFATTFVNRAGSMVLPFLALYGTRHLGVRSGLAGLALTIYGVGGLVGAYSSTFRLALLIGPWAGTIALDRLGGTALWIAAFVRGVMSAAVLSMVDSPRAVVRPDVS